MVSSTARVCAATTKAGSACAAYACKGSCFCFWHDPERAEDRAGAWRRGGQGRHGRSLAVSGAAGPVQMRQVQGVLPLLDRAVNDVLALENSVARARAIGYLVGVGLRALELTDLAERVTALEEKVLAGGTR